MLGESRNDCWAEAQPASFKAMSIERVSREVYFFQCIKIAYVTAYAGELTFRACFI